MAEASTNARVVTWALGTVLAAAISGSVGWQFATVVEMGKVLAALKQQVEDLGKCAP